MTDNDTTSGADQASDDVSVETTSVFRSDFLNELDPTTTAGTGGNPMTLVADPGLVAEGEEDQVKDLLAWSQHGPSTARVDKVDTRWRSYTGEFADFRIVNE